MEITELNQIVFVVIDHEEQKVIGAFNDEDTAKKVASDMEKPTYDGSEITITPVLVDTVNWVTDSRKFYLYDDQMQKALADEIDLAMPYDEGENEDEDADEDEDEDEDEDYDPIEADDPVEDEEANADTDPTDDEYYAPVTKQDYINETLDRVMGVLDSINHVLNELRE